MDSATASATVKPWDGLRTFRVERKEPESETVTSFYLAAADGEPVAPHRPGQLLGFELDVTGHEGPVSRTYTISEAPGLIDGYRVSIKREPAAGPGLAPGVASNYFHDHVEVGSELRVRAPAGVFFLDTAKRTPVVLLSGGVGLTPMIAMLDSIAQSGGDRPVWFIHAVRNRREHAFGQHVRLLAAQHANVKVHIHYDEIGADDLCGRDHDGEGFLSAELISELTGGVVANGADVYLCGPPPFMKALYTGLRGLGVGQDRIYYEFFGEAQSLEEDAAASPPATESPQVTFKRAGVTVTWDPAKANLLELAEANGIEPDFSCRSGLCRTCLTPLLEGKVEYADDSVLIPDDDGEVLICSSRPVSDVVLDI